MSGTDGALFTPPYPEAFNEIASGESTVERASIISSVGVGNSGELRLVYFTARKSELTGNVRLLGGATAAGATPTLVRAGLYTIAANGDGALVAAIANDTAIFAVANTAYTRAWTAPYQKVAGQRLALGILVVTAAAMPAVLGIGGAGDDAEFAVAPRVTARLTGQADLPATFASGALVLSSGRFYAAILP